MTQITDDLWKDLVATALIGTDRRSPQLPTAGDTLSSVLARLDQSEPERALLAAAAAASLHRRAGFTLPHDHRPLPSQCEADELPRCNDRAASHWRSMLERRSDYGDIPREWLQTATEAGYRLPEELLAQTLDMGTSKPNWRWLIIDTVGKRGRWLAQQNPTWDFAAVGESEDEWYIGNGKARAWLVNRLRKAHPPTGRKLLESTWAEESAEDRNELLSGMYTGLSMDDEPFLEAALDDSSERVRSSVAWILLRLPESHFYQRMLERLAPLFKVVKAKLKKPYAEIALPVECDRAMARDGVKREPPRGRKAIGEQAHWLVEMLSCINPSYWLETFDVTAMELVAAIKNARWSDDVEAVLKAAAEATKASDKEAAQTDFRDVLLEAIAHAAIRHDEAAVADALIENEFDHVLLTPGLLGLLSPSRREALVLKALKKHKEPLKGDHPALQLVNNLTGCHHMWSSDLTLKMLAALKEAVKTLKDYNDANDLSKWLLTFAAYMDPDLVEDANEAVTVSEKNNNLYWWNREAKKFIKLVRFRQKMLKELA